METQYALIIGLFLAFYIYKIVTGRIKYSRLVTLINSNESHTIIDVRTSGEFSSGHIPGAKNIPVEKIGNGLGKIKKDENVVLYCQSGSRAARALATLKSKGYRNSWNFGGVSRWRGQLER